MLLEADLSNCLQVLCGRVPTPKCTLKNCPLNIPEDDRYIKDRSISCRPDDRALAVDYLEHVVRCIILNGDSRRKNCKVRRQTFSSNVSLAGKQCRSIRKRVGKSEVQVEYINLIVSICPDSNAESDQKNELEVDCSEALVIGAHFDVQNNWSDAWKGKDDSDEKSPFVATEGADDNGSGVIGLLDFLSRSIESDFLKRISKPIVLVFFDGEEPGALNRAKEGSRQFAKQFCQENRLPQLGISVDMIGRNNSSQLGFALSISTNFPSHLSEHLRMAADLKEKIKEKMLVEEPFLLVNDQEETTRCFNHLHLTDSASFCDLNIPAMSFTDYGDIRKSPAYYHTRDDTFDEVSIGLIQLAVNIVWEVATCLNAD
jgi:hypothetical protein